VTSTRWEPPAAGALAGLRERVVSCAACPRLVAWREQAALAPRLPTGAISGPYWSRPLPGFGDPKARLMLVGLAPAAHGGNRTGRMFTGDRSGDFLFAALHRAGYASQPESVSADDGLRLRGAYVTAAVRCAPPENKPTPSERDACAPFLEEELALLGAVRVYLTLGRFALDALRSQPAVAAALGGIRPAFGHGAETALADGRHIVASYHPSQRNVFTGLLTAPMFDAVLARAADLGARPGHPPAAPRALSAP
jgi:uracil-DNA glycosylase family 4